MDSKLQQALKEAHDSAKRAIAVAEKHPDDPKARVVINLGQRYLPRLARLLTEPEAAEPENGKSPAKKSPVKKAKPDA